MKNKKSKKKKQVPLDNEIKNTGSIALPKNASPVCYLKSEDIREEWKE